MGLRPAKSHEKLVLQDWWGGPHWPAADAPVGLLAPRKMLISLCRLRDEGVPRGPGGPPHQAPRMWFFDPVQASYACLSRPEAGHSPPALSFLSCAQRFCPPSSFCSSCRPVRRMNSPSPSTTSCAVPLWSTVRRSEEH